MMLCTVYIINWSDTMVKSNSTMGMKHSSTQRLLLDTASKCKELACRYYTCLRRLLALSGMEIPR